MNKPLASETSTLMGEKGQKRLNVIIQVIGIATITIFLTLSLLHVYWAFGGHWGLTAAIPIVEGKPLLEIGLWDTLAIALALLFAAVICLGTFKYRLPFLPNWIYQAGIWVIALVFLLRAIGEFHYAGFFKQVNDSLFAHWDTVLYTPLCLGLSSCCIILAIVCGAYHEKTTF
jgi:glucan phosphoethanolaminetransferase (alkaline phosphatase superfamily)